MKNLISLCLTCLTLIFVSILFPNSLKAQYNYHKAFNLGYDVHTPAHKMTAGGEYINTGFYFPTVVEGQISSSARLPIVKLDGGFNVQWAKHYILNSELQNGIFDADMRAYDVQDLFDGGFVVCGEMAETDAAGAVQKHSFIMQLDGGGNVIWHNKYFENGNLNSIVQTSDGGFMACGYVNIPGGGEENRLLRINSSGNAMWLRTMQTTSGSGPWSAFREIVRHSTNRYVAVGNCATLIESDFCVQESDILLTFIDESGGSPTFTNLPIGRGTDPAGFQFAEYGNTLTVNGQGNILIAGHVKKSNVNDCDPNTAQDLLLLKVHPAGIVMFARETDLKDQDIGRDVTINSFFSEVCVAGISDNDAFLFTTDMSGNFIKLEFFNHAGFPTIATSVLENSSGKYTFIGNSEVMGSGYDDIYLVEQDPVTTMDCHDWDEARDPVNVDLEVFDGDDIQLEVDNIQVIVEAIDISVIDTVLCASGCTDPIATDDVVSVCEDSSLTVNVYANDSYTAPVSGSILSGPSNGTATLISSSGVLNYVPNSGFNGSDLIDYQIIDACGTSTAQVQITVSPLPEVLGYSITTSGLTVSFSSISVFQTSWDWDFGDGSPHAFVHEPIHTYASDGTYTVCVTVSNDCGSDSLCFEITVESCDPVDPIQDEVDICTPNGGGFNILLNDYYSSTITYTLFSGPSNGSIISDDGNGNLYYVPNSGFIGNDTITYRLCNLCGMCGEALIIIHVDYPPVASFITSASGPTLSFTDISSNNPTSWSWDFGDGFGSTLQNPSHTYATSGTFTVCLTATNHCGSDTRCEDFIIQLCNQVDPVGDEFDICGPNGGIVNPLLNDYFTASPPLWHVTGGPFHGTISYVQPNGNIYYVPASGYVGNDTIYYELCDGCGNCYPEMIVIHVNQAPVANFSGTTSLATVFFNDLSTNNPTSWSWDFGDGTGSVFQNPVHTYSAPGTYSVCLTATNICGSNTLCEDFTIQFCDQVDPVRDDFDICGPNGGIVNPLLNDYFSASPPVWNITGGPFHGIITSVQPNGNIYYVPNSGYVGNDTIHYELCDGCGNCYPEMIVIHVNQAPVANFSGTTSSATVFFNDLSTNNPTSWSWDFGDGSGSMIQNPVHTYSAPGTYSVCLTATNICGSNTLCEDFTIQFCDQVDPVRDDFDICGPNGGVVNPLLNDYFNASPPVWNITGGPFHGIISSVQPNGDIYYMPNSGYIGNDTIHYELCDGCGNCYPEMIVIHVNQAPVANFALSISGHSVMMTDLSTNNPTSWSWSFGDGTGSNAQNPSHTYSSDGTYSICLTVTNNCGTNTICEEITITTMCPPPTAVQDSIEVCPDETVTFNVLINDSYTAPQTLSIVVPPVHGTITFFDPVLGDVTYVADPTFPGSDSFIYLLSDACSSDTARVDLTCWTDDPILVTPRVFPEGLFNPSLGQLNDDLNQLGMLPQAQPFGGAPWNYTGLELVSSYADFQNNGNYGNAVDWVMVFLMDANDPGTILARKAGLLWQSGHVTEADGSILGFAMNQAHYFVAVMPRNHLGVTSGNTYSLDKSSTKLVDFTAPSTSTWGGMTAQKAQGPVMLMYSGDANADGFINSVDLNGHWRVQNGGTPAYSNTADFNCDGSVNSVDLNGHFRINNGAQAMYPFFWP